MIKAEDDMWNALYSVRADGRVIRRLIPDRNVHNATFSPDGRRAMFESQVTSEWAISIVTLDGSGRRVLFESDDSQRSWWGDPAWSPDGRSVALVHSTRETPERLVVADLDDRHPVEVYKDRDRAARHSSPAWSPDGRRIAFVRSVQEATRFSIWVVNADGTEAHVLVKDVSQQSQIAWSPDGRFLAFVSEADEGISTYDFTSGRVELRGEREYEYGWHATWSAAGDLVYLRFLSVAVPTAELVSHDLIRDVPRVIEWRGGDGALAAANPCGPNP